METFIADFNRRHGGRVQGLTPQALSLLMAHAWPGNVRELKNAVESAAILATGETVGAEGFADLAARGRGPARPAWSGAGLALPVGTTLAEAERELIAATLARHPVRREAAAVLGIGLRTLYTKLRIYRLEGPPPVPKRH